MNRVFTVRNALILLAWSGTLFGVLSLANLPGEWGHSVCGVGGCGPPLQALVSCHLAWLVFLGPLAELVTRSSPRPSDLQLQLGKLLCLISALLVLAVVANQRATWWPAVNELQQRYFWQRCGFVIVTSVDVPMIPMLVVGLALICRERCFSFPPEEKSSSHGSGAVRLP